MQGKTILIAEDESEIRELLALLLETERYTVLKASDGQEALRIVNERRDGIDLLITDLGLPKLGGLELIQHARSLSPSIKIIAASGFGHANVREELRKAGVLHFFPKPFSPMQMLETAKRLLTE
ncbi:MAG: multi-sensor hybrid histidine kinase [Bacteroidetes bacterium]|nr:multi-sensor hybrid histidine kinase [Bacteroidota bacterium]